MNLKRLKENDVNLEEIIYEMIDETREGQFDYEEIDHLTLEGATKVIIRMFWEKVEGIYGKVIPISIKKRWENEVYETCATFVEENHD